MVYQARKLYRELPEKVRQFLLRALFLFIGWLLVYNLVLKPLRFPDKQLTRVVEYGTAKILSAFYPDVHIEGIAIYVASFRAVGIADECNGLELIVLYIGFLLCFRTTKKRTAFFAITGTFLIYLCNIARCAALAVMNMHHHPFVNFAHHYAFKLIIYGIVFLGWTLYTKKFMNNAAV